MLTGLFFAFVFGTVIGSFLNALVYRGRHGLSMWGRSMCPDCKRVVRWQHLVPIVSYLMLRGRCADCGKRIHPSYPMVELLAGLLVVAAYLANDPWQALFTLSLLALAAFDARWMLLPVEPMRWLALAGLFLHAFRGDAPDSAFGLLLGVAFLGLQFILSRGRWIGSGDVWLAAAIGAWLGLLGMAAAFYLAYIIGGIVALPLLLSGRAKRGHRLAFAPFLVLGAFGSLWFGDALIRWFAGALGLA